MTLSTLYKAEQRSLSTTTPSVIVSYHLCSTPTLTYNQLQKYLRYCTVFWFKWPVHDLVLVTPPPTLIKVASNTRPCSKLGGRTLNGGRSSDLKHERLFFSRECLNIFATGCSSHCNQGAAYLISACFTKSIGD